jgi:hypothetical protein
MTFPIDDLFGDESRPHGTGAPVIHKPTLPARTGWADAAKATALANDDGLFLGEISN